MSKKTTEGEKVFYEEREVCVVGNADYLIDMAFQGVYSVSEDFASAVCNLPKDYTEKIYSSFLKSWGTVRDSDNKQRKHSTVKIGRCAQFFLQRHMFTSTLSQKNPHSYTI